MQSQLRRRRCFRFVEELKKSTYLEDVQNFRVLNMDELSDGFDRCSNNDKRNLQSGRGVEKLRLNSTALPKNSKLLFDVREWDRLLKVLLTITLAERAPK